VLDRRVTAITGEDLELHADTICLHGDTPGAVSLAASLREAFGRAGVETVPMGSLVAR
jgi:5-oxoprolinase (ATP-hydrolysing) subunit A